MMIRLRSVNMKIDAAIRDPLTNQTHNYFGPQRGHERRELVVDTDMRMLHVIAGDGEARKVRSVAAEGIRDCELPDSYGARLEAFLAKDREPSK